MTPEELGTIIRDARVAQGLRQDQLAAAAGVGVRFLIELERGKSTAQLGKALAVLDVLGCRVEIRPPAPPRSDRS
jgi:y4mF family transcriptional regulator